jgi:8-oxo-dGTP pyrophosphatase MutT (NUDIX family)
MAWPKGWGDDLRTRLRREASVEEGYRVVSAVLAPIAWNPEHRHNHIVLMKRTMTVGSHQGQISFPGGVREVGDATLLDTALRETEEEIGLVRGELEVLGALSPVQTRSEVIIFPWVARHRHPYDFRPSPAEVDRLLFLPVETLIREGLQGVMVPMGAINVKSEGLHFEGELIWGATGRMLKELRELLVGLDVSQPV